MAERTPWWRAFLGKRKSASPKEAATPAHTLGEDFNPFAVKPEKPKDPAAAATTSDPAATTTPGGGDRSRPHEQPSGGPPPETTAAAQTTTTSTSLLSDETFDDSQLESVFNEQSCRRNMRVSRSGRFKEKRRVRSSLPIEEKEAADKAAAASGKEDPR